MMQKIGDIVTAACPKPEPSGVSASARQLVGGPMLGTTHSRIALPDSFAAIAAGGQ